MCVCPCYYLKDCGSKVEPEYALRQETKYLQLRSPDYPYGRRTIVWVNRQQPLKARGVLNDQLLEALSVMRKVAFFRGITKFYYSNSIWRGNGIQKGSCGGPSRKMATLIKRKRNLARL